ncbi:hypothetical protein COLO4_36837 [Corchorus olitorius]|uniref:Uncharacterized protein n=1 Tax=Corchorus olitorius TaxID=93759 RepID=A0A1R3G4Y7_9ROSI|nr:hypothetical protein COLO4_36837 [Corchorus olitorius]
MRERVCKNLMPTLCEGELASEVILAAEVAFWWLT